VGLPAPELRCANRCPLSRVAEFVGLGLGIAAGIRFNWVEAKAPGPGKRRPPFFFRPGAGRITQLAADLAIA